MIVDHEALTVALNAQKLILCNTEEERNTILRYLRDHGYMINPTSLTYLDGLSQTNFMHVGFSIVDESTIACHNRDLRGNGIPYSEIFKEDTAEEVELEAMDESSFLAAFSALLGYKQEPVGGLFYGRVPLEVTARPVASPF